MVLINRIIIIVLFIFLTACAKQSSDPVVIKTPELGAMAPYTDQVSINFKFLDASGQVEKSSCDFQWSADKRMVGSCNKLSPGIYQYRLEYRDKTTRELLGQADGSVEIGQDNDVSILPLVIYNSSNVTALIARVNALPPGDRQTGSKPQMVRIARGSFQMGDESSSDGVTKGSGFDTEVPVHTVTVAAFELGKYEVTFDEYDAYLKDTGKSILLNQGSGEGADESWGRGQRPVINVSWNDIQAYLKWLNTQQGITLDDPKRYRLPTEAEWEYAARAGSTTAYSWGNDIGTNNANCSGSLCGDSFSNTAPVGSFAANPFGLHDMHGNVWEWLEDCWHNSYTGAPNDGSAWTMNCTDASRRVLRGGSWDDLPRYLRSAARGWLSTTNRWDGSGFRLARTL